MVAGLPLVDRAKANKYGSALYKYAAALEPIVKLAQLPLMQQTKAKRSLDYLTNKTRTIAMVLGKEGLEHKSKV